MPSSGLLTLYHPALDAGSSPVWIPVFTGMTHPLSSSTESSLVILNRKRSASDWGSIPSRHSALDAGSRQKDWIPVFTGMTEGGRE